MTALEHILLSLLRENPAGLGEYELLKALQQRACEGFPRVSLTDNMALFKMHFRLYHALYRLRERLAETRHGHLSINALEIRLRPYTASTAQTLDEPDPLRDYYLNAANLDAMSEAELQGMLGRFWSRLGAADGKQQALDTLGLREPTDYAQIKRRYRQLAMRHHPDRGGDTAELQRVHQAMQVLERYYRG